jgi:signal transduction histidine kinase
VFKSATLKLTTWYLAILIAISLLFSVVIYSIASSEVGSRLGYFQSAPQYSFNINNRTVFDNYRELQIHEAEASLITSLFITNICIWIAGGIGSYYLARRTLQPIEEAHEAQSRFTSDASHELRTPLASMKAEIEVALRDPSLSKAEMHELLESNLEEVNKLSNLSHMLLQLSRLEHDGIAREEVPLTETIASVIERTSKTNTRIVFNPGKPRAVAANTSSVEELLAILLDNALKYSPDDSKVTINSLHKKDMAGFEIINAGDGIPADVLPHIFERFYRADTSRTSGDKKGYGLGLALAKKIVELNKGELSVSSAPGQLTTFKVLLPIFSLDKVKNQ